MYDELVKDLRKYSCPNYSDGCGMCPSFKYGCAIRAIQQAADAIEELTAYVRQIEELRKDGYYLQKTKMMTYGQATMTMPLPTPPKEEAT